MQTPDTSSGIKMETLTSHLNKTSELLDSNTYRAKVERYGTDTAKAVLRSHDLLTQLIKELTVGRNYGSAGWSTTEAELQEQVKAVDSEQMISVIDGMIRWFDNHDLLKGEHLVKDESGNSAAADGWLAGCAEGAASAHMAEVDDPDGTNGLGRLLGTTPPGSCEIAANATIEWLRDQLGKPMGMTPTWNSFTKKMTWDVQENNPLARFNDQPGMTKDKMVAFLWDMRCELEFGRKTVSFTGDEYYFDGGKFNTLHSPALTGEEATYTPEPALAESE